MAGSSGGNSSSEIIGASSSGGRAESESRCIEICCEVHMVIVSVEEDNWSVKALIKRGMWLAVGIVMTILQVEKGVMEIHPWFARRRGLFEK